jgi:hypothetical protein
VVLGVCVVVLGVRGCFVLGSVGVLCSGRVGYWCAGGYRYVSASVGPLSGCISMCVVVVT